VSKSPGSGSTHQVPPHCCRLWLVNMYNPSLISHTWLHWLLETDITPKNKSFVTGALCILQNWWTTQILHLFTDHKYVGCCCWYKFWYRDLRGSGRTVYVDRKRCLNTGWGQETCYRFSGVAGHECYSPQELILRVMEGVAGQEGDCSEDWLLSVVGRKGREDCGLECEASSKPHGTANVFGVSLQVLWSPMAKSDPSIKIYEGIQLPSRCTVDRLSQLTILHCKITNNYITIPK
jgi:hypothetical protein